jgi:hypothetical protein
MPEHLKIDKACPSATETREGWSRWLTGVLTGPVKGVATGSVFLEGVLPQDEFLDRLRSEIRRVDRSQAPLSMVLFMLGVVTGTYPDQLFQEVLERKGNQSKILTLQEGRDG